EALVAELGGQLGPQGRLQGRVTLQTPMSESGALDGAIEIDLADLGLIELFSAQAVVTPQGRLRAELALSGTRAEPQLAGAAELLDFSAELPALGIAPSDGHARIDLSTPQSARVEFGFRSEG